MAGRPRPEPAPSAVLELREVRRTVEAFLDAGYYRLRQAARLTTLDIDDGMDRLALHLSSELAALWSARP